MSLGNMGQRTEGIRKQAGELIEQAYQRGFKNGENSRIDECAKALDEAVIAGRDEAWEAARKIMSQNDASWGMKDMKEIFGLSYSSDIMLDLTASEAIEKIRAYGERKKHEQEGCE